MMIFGYYWKGTDHAFSDLLYHSFGLWTSGRVLDEITTLIHPEFGSIWREHQPVFDAAVDEAFSRGYEACMADRESAG